MTRSYLEKIFEEETLIRTKTTIPLQIFYEDMFDSKVIFKSIIGPDDTGTETSRH